MGFNSGFKGLMVKPPCNVSSVSSGSEYEPEKNLSGGNLILRLLT